MRLPTRRDSNREVSMTAAPNQLSFLPDDYLAQKAQRRTNIFCAVLFLIVMTGIGAAFKVSEVRNREIEKQHATIDEQYTEAAKRIAQFQQLQAKQRTMARQAELTSA